MINPQIQIEAETQIHAARAAVWHKFIALHEWPHWFPAVKAATWEVGHGWQEGSQFQVRFQAGDRQQTWRSIIRMVSTESVTVWEVLEPSERAVYTLHCNDQLGGCKVTIRCRYHGLTALWHWVQRRQRRQTLDEILAALKTHFAQRTDYA